MVKNYRVVLKSTGRITQLPDSQKIFGALITAFSRMNGSEQANRLVKSVFEKKSHVALSNVLPLGYFPVPQDYIVDKLAKRLPDSESLKEHQEQVKKRDYVRISDITRMLEQPEICCSLYPYIKTSDTQQLRFSIESVRYGIEGLETKLYTVPVLTLEEVREEGAGRVSELCFYLQADESGEGLTEIIKELEEREESLILGKRASQGLNKYQVKSLEEIELPDSKYYLNLGMLLPDKIDFQKSTLKLFTSQRRPFTMSGGWDKDCGKQFISFIDKGSIIVLKEGIEQAGKCVTSPFNSDRDIVFGNAFLYPITWKKEECK